MKSLALTSGDMEKAKAEISSLNKMLIVAPVATLIFYAMVMAMFSFKFFDVENVVFAVFCFVFLLIVGGMIWFSKSRLEADLAAGQKSIVEGAVSSKYSKRSDGRGSLSVNGNRYFLDNDQYILYEVGETVHIECLPKSRLVLSIRKA